CVSGIGYSLSDYW
nr:immunoglobulin heavy chain junction region [Macaca mulatta]